MSCSLRSLAALGILAFLAGCAPSATGPGSAPSDHSVRSTTSGWRMLSADPEDGKEAPRPAGYVEARRVLGPGGEEGTVYMVYDQGFLPVGHVTQGGAALRYGAGSRAEDQPLGRALVADQLAAILGVRGPLRIYDMTGRLKELP